MTDSVFLFSAVGSFSISKISAGRALWFKKQFEKRSENLANYTLYSFTLILYSLIPERDRKFRKRQRVWNRKEDTLVGSEKQSPETGDRGAEPGLQRGGAWLTEGELR